MGQMHYDGVAGLKRAIGELDASGVDPGVQAPLVGNGCPEQIGSLMAAEAPQEVETLDWCQGAWDLADGSETPSRADARSEGDPVLDFQLEDLAGLGGLERLRVLLPPDVPLVLWGCATVCVVALGYLVSAHMA